jgi:hypothetical protein
MIRQLAHIFIPGAGLLRRQLPHKPDALSSLDAVIVILFSAFVTSHRFIASLFDPTPDADT